MCKVHASGVASADLLKPSSCVTVSLPFAPSSLAFARSASQETAAKGFIDFISVELRAIRRDRGRAAPSRLAVDPYRGDLPRVLLRFLLSKFGEAVF